MLKPEHLSGPPATLHFVANEKCAVFAARPAPAGRNLSLAIYILCLVLARSQSGDIAFAASRSSEAMSSRGCVCPIGP